MPLEKTFWGALYGAFTDQFGVKWMVNCQLDTQFFSPYRDLSVSIRALNIDIRVLRNNH